jgi:hypothetical protein
MCGNAFFGQWCRAWAGWAPVPVCAFLGCADIRQQHSSLCKRCVGSLWLRFQVIRKPTQFCVSLANFSLSNCPSSRPSLSFRFSQWLLLSPQHWPARLPSQRHHSFNLAAFAYISSIFLDRESPLPVFFLLVPFSACSTPHLKHSAHALYPQWPTAPSLVSGHRTFSA